MNHQQSQRGANITRSLGPVSDLERHLPADWWRNLFKALYLKTDGDVVENEANTVQDVDQLIAATGIGPDDRILDLCCGQGRHSIELARRDFQHVTGVDRSRYLVRLARRRAERLGLKLTFREGDARKFRLPEASFDCVFLMGNSFGYFEREEDDLAVLRAVLRVLKSGGKILLDVADGDWMRTHFEARSWEWVDQNHFVCRERALASDQVRLISREVVTHVERGVIADQFYAERLYTCEELKQFLRTAGFVGVNRVAAPATDSDRQQDLGMMAHRIFVVATAPEPRVRRMRPKGPMFRDVTVLLGDPRLPDDVKREGQFNPEDIDTVRKMKDALATLKDYNFAYWDDHDGLLDFMRRERPAFVFNLCDEGFMNDPFKELHVPAVLELFGVPYSGGAPACLGMCYNKALVRTLAQAIEIPVPLETYSSPDDQAATLPSLFPALLKPNFGDSSQGITKDAVVHNKEELIDYLEHLRREFPRRPVLVQEFLTGPEYSVGVVGNPGLDAMVLPPLEVDYSRLPDGLPPILGYESKWIPDSPYWNDIGYHEADISEGTKRTLNDYALALFERLECRDYARFDFRADAQGRIKLLEVNPNPGWCWDGKLNYMAGFAGLEYTDLLRLVLEAAQTRYQAAGVTPAEMPAAVR